MSLPKEPRQKMINIMYLFLTAMLALNISAEILNAFKTVNRSLENTNTTVNTSTDAILKSLLQKTMEDATRERATMWYPKAQEAVKISKELYDYIGTIKKEILTLAGATAADPTKYDEGNQSIVTKLMVDDKKAKELFAKLSEYKKRILAIDPAIDSNFKESLQIDLSNPPGQDGKVKPWEIAYFNMVPTVAGLTILSKFQNDIKTNENKVVAFCHQKVGEVKLVFDSYAAIVGQSTNYAMPGQEIEITAGVGAYSKSSSPQISINGAGVSLGEEGYASYKMTASSVGSHTVPVKISYFNQVTGKQEVLEKNVEYTVAAPGGTSVALEEMNVLYIGWSNKVRIAASGAGDEKLQVSISGGGGSISKTGAGTYIASVTSPTNDCKINVTVDGKTSSFPFRVRNIPDPVATIGGVMSNDNMSAGQAKAQTGVGAFIKDFPLDIKYQVVSYTIGADNADGDIIEASVQGNMFNGPALNIMKGLSAGRTLSVDNVRAQGPDGKVRKIPGLIYYIK